MSLHDRIAVKAGGLKFRDKLVLLDTFAVPRLPSRLHASPNTGMTVISAPSSFENQDFMI
jgi:hypothetical protein